MKASEFCYWLQGHFELNGTKEISAEQAKIIQNHLNLVFLHEIDPAQGLTLEQAVTAQATHDGEPVMRC